MRMTRELTQCGIEWGFMGVGGGVGERRIIRHVVVNVIQRESHDGRTWIIVADLFFSETNRHWQIDGGANEEEPEF